MNKQIILYILLVFTFASCEKVITLNLKSATETLVIEGVITQKARECYVYISKTQPIEEWNKFDGLSFAKVAITDAAGKTDSLKEIEKGIYYNATLKGVPGQTYHLSVSIDEQLYTATTTMPATVVPMDSISIEYDEAYENYTTSVYFTDPAREENNYLFYLYKNNKKYNSFFLQNDEFFNGKNVKQQLLIFSNEEEDKIHRGDTVKVRMLQIEKPVYTYFYSLNAGALGGTGGPGSFGSPANPVSNIRGGDVLGYFSAHITDNGSIHVKQ